MNYKMVTAADQFPAEDHYAAVVFGKIYIPGDARSKAAPGHGYPAHEKSITEYIAFASRDDMLAWVSFQERQPVKQKYRVFKSTPLPVEVAIAVKVG
jgi:hypothetical protein